VGTEREELWSVHHFNSWELHFSSTPGQADPLAQQLFKTGKVLPCKKIEEKGKRKVVFAK
jgi:hypothetical protein